jgi:hypothetical protein
VSGSVHVRREGQDLGVVRGEHHQVAAAEHAVSLAQRDHPLHPPQQAARVVLVRLDVHRLDVVLGVDDHRQEQPLRVRPGEATVAVARPLHRRADPVAVPEVDVVAHPDLVAVVQDRGTRQAEQQRVHQLDQPTVVAEQRCEAPPDAQVDAHVVLARVGAVHVVTFLVGDHLERELVVVAQEDAPLALLGDLWRLLQDVHDGEPVLLRDGHEQPRHQGEVEVHLALVAVPEVGRGVLGPLVGLREEHPTRVPVEVAAQLLEEGVGLGQVLAVGAVPHEQVRDRVQTHAVHTGLRPEVQHLLDRLSHVG